MLAELCGEWMIRDGSAWLSSTPPDRAQPCEKKECKLAVTQALLGWTVRMKAGIRPSVTRQCGLLLRWTGDPPYSPVSLTLLTDAGHMQEPQLLLEHQAGSCTLLKTSCMPLTGSHQPRQTRLRHKAVQRVQAHAISGCWGLHDVQVAERLRQSILGLYDRHLSEDGKAVDYAALKQDPGFRCCLSAS